MHAWSFCSVRKQEEYGRNFLKVIILLFYSSIAILKSLISHSVSRLPWFLRKFLLLFSLFPLFVSLTRTYVCIRSRLFRLRVNYTSTVLFYVWSLIPSFIEDRNLEFKATIVRRSIKMYSQGHSWAFKTLLILLASLYEFVSYPRARRNFFAFYVGYKIRFSSGQRS